MTDSDLYYKIPAYSRIVLGHDKRFLEEKINIPKLFFKDRPPGDLALMKNPGDSMYPAFSHRSLLAVDFSMKDASPGIVLYNLNGYPTIGRLMVGLDGWAIKYDNPVYKTIDVPEDPTKITGKLVACWDFF